MSNAPKVFEGRKTSADATGRFPWLPHSLLAMTSPLGWRMGPFWFVLPALVVYLLMMVFPLLSLVGLSLVEWNGFSRSPMEWVGLQNYREILLNDRVFWLSLRNNIFYAVMVVSAWSSISLMLALLLSTRPRGFTFYRAIFFAPAVISEVAIAIAWRQILEPNVGFLSTILRALGVNNPPSLLGNPDWVLPTLALVSIWQYVGYSMVIYLAGLQTLPQEVEEAARVDGAGPLQVVRHVTLPLLRPTTLIVLTLNIIGGLKVFTVVYAMTKGAPAHASEVVTTYMYLQAYTLNNQGYASAVAMLLIIVIVFFTIVFRRSAGHTRLD